MGGLTVWIDDVVAHTTIRSVWGNQVRDRVVQTFGTLAEAQTHLAALPQGSVIHTDDSGLLYHKFAGAWKPVFPAVVEGTPVNTNGYYLTAGVTATIFNAAIPAGYRYVMLSAFAQIDSPGGLDYNAEARLNIGNGAFLVSVATWRGPKTSAPQTHSIAGFHTVGGAEGATMTVRNAQAAGDVSVSGNQFYTNLSILCLP